MSSKPAISLNQEYDDIFKFLETKVIILREHDKHGKGRVQRK